MIRFVSNTIQVHVAAYFEEYQVYKFLLLKRSMHEVVYPGIWQVITGTIEGNETAVMTALREVKEETGYSPLKLWTIPYITRYFSPKHDTIQASPVFGMLIDPVNPVVLSDEHERFEWLHLDLAMEKLVLPSHREATKIFHEFILASGSQDLFEIKHF